MTAVLSSGRRISDMPGAAREQGLGPGGHRHGAHGHSARDREGEVAAAATAVAGGPQREVSSAGQEAQQGAAGEPGTLSFCGTEDFREVFINSFHSCSFRAMPGIFLCGN